MTTSRIRGIAAAGAGLAMAAVSLTMGAGTAAAAVPAAAAADTNCSGYGIGALVDAAYIKRSTTNVGSVQLCERLRDGQWVRWTAVTLYQQLKADEWANGHIVSRPDGVIDPLIRLTCKTGTGDIRPPRTTCASEGTPWVSTWEDKAEAYIYKGANNITAVGATDWNG